MEESVEKCQQALVSPKTCIFFKNLRLLAKFVKTFFLITISIAKRILAKYKFVNSSCTSSEV